MKKRTAPFVLLCFVASLSVAQTTYYVANTGSDSNPGNTLIAPFLTISKAVSMVGAGDTVYIRSGIYPEYIIIDKNGTSTSRITFAGYPGDSALPVIDGSGIQTTLANRWERWCNLINVEGDWITLKRLEVRNAASRGIFVKNNNVIIDRVYSHNNYYTGIYLSKCFFGLVINCTIHDCFDYSIDGSNPGVDADGLGSTSGNEDPTIIIYGYHHFTGNTIYNCSDDGIDTWTSQFDTIDHNYVHNCGYTNSSNGGYHDSIGLQAGDGNGFKLGRGGNNLVRNNLAYNNRMREFDVNDGSGNVMVNNTAFDTVNSAGSCFAIYTPGNTAINNISFGSPNILSGIPVEDHNNWNLGITDPVFLSTDVNSPDFLHLAYNSPAIDAGVYVGITFFGNAPDLGAFEFQLNNSFEEFPQDEKEVLLIFPNPVTEILHLRWLDENIPVSSIEIFNNMGEQVFWSDCNLSRIDLKSFANGIYFMHVYASENIISKTIIVNK